MGLGGDEQKSCMTSYTQNLGIVVSCVCGHSLFISSTAVLDGGAIQTFAASSESTF